MRYLANNIFNYQVYDVLRDMRLMMFLEMRLAGLLVQIHLWPLVNHTLYKKCVAVFTYRQSFCKKCYLQIGNTDFCSVLQQLFSHICLAKLILSCCFARAALARRPKGAKQQERINFAKQMCEKSCWRTTQILQIALFAKWLTICRYVFTFGISWTNMTSEMYAATGQAMPLSTE